MYPFLKPGDKLVVKPVLAASIEKGDIVIIRDDSNKIIAHRLVKKLTGDTGITKGDSLLSQDSETINLSKIIGKLETIARKRKFIPVSSGYRNRIKGVFVWLSTRCMTSGALRLRAKNIFRWLFIRASDKTDLEQKFILDILKGDFQVIPAGINWERVAGISDSNGVSGIIYQQLRGLQIPQLIFKSLENQYHHTVAQNLACIQAMKLLDQTLDDQKIDVMLLKGAALLDNTYCKVGMRPMCDIDLLVRPWDKVYIEKCLNRIGYENEKLNLHVFTKKCVVIDIHNHALNTDRIKSREILFPAGMNPVWDKVVPWKSDFKRLKRPDKPDMVLLLSQHLMKHSFSGFIWFFDIYLLLREQNKSDWEKLFKRAEYLQQIRPLSYVLHCLKLLFNFDPMEVKESNHLLSRISFVERALLDTCKAPRYKWNIAPMISLFCIDGLMNKIRFIKENIFLKQEVIKEEFSQFFWSRRILLYPKRIFQAMAISGKYIILIVKQVLRERGIIR